MNFLLYVFDISLSNAVSNNFLRQAVFMRCSTAPTSHWGCSQVGGESRGGSHRPSGSTAPIAALLGAPLQPCPSNR